MSGDQIRVNGCLHDWGSIIVKAGGVRYYGFKSVSYPDKLETEHAYGQGKAHAPRGDSAGKYVPGPGKLAGPKSTMQALRADLAAQASDGRSYGKVRFYLTAEYVEDGDTPILDEVFDCRLVGNGADYEEAPGVLLEECEITYRRVLRNGLSLYDSSEGI